MNHGTSPRRADRTPTLVYTVGLPASGKTTTIRRWVAEDPTTRVRVNRDDLRDMLFGPSHAYALTRSCDPDDHARKADLDVLLRQQEDLVTVVQHTAIVNLLAAGVDVGSDDTNLQPGVRAALQGLAWDAGAEVRVADMTFVSTEECISRDCVRLVTGERHVGEPVIRRMEPLVNAWRMTGGEQVTTDR